MVTGKRSILLQRAVRAEHGERIAKADAEQARAALAETRSALARMCAAATLSAELTPVTQLPEPNTQVQLVRVRVAVHTGGQWRDPHTGAPVNVGAGAYWRPMESDE